MVKHISFTRMFWSLASSYQRDPKSLVTFPAVSSAEFEVKTWPMSSPPCCKCIRATVRNLRWVRNAAMCTITTHHHHHHHHHLNKGWSFLLPPWQFKGPAVDQLYQMPQMARHCGGLPREDPKLWGPSCGATPSGLRSAFCRLGTVAQEKFTSDLLSTIKLPKNAIDWEPSFLHPCDFSRATLEPWLHWLHSQQPLVEDLSGCLPKPRYQVDLRDAETLKFFHFFLGGPVMKRK